MSVRKEVSSMAAPCSSGNVAERLLVAEWDQLHSVKFGGSNSPSSYYVGKSNAAAIERMPSFQCFGSESLSDIMSSFTLPESGQMATALCPRDFPSTNELSSEKNFKAKKRKKLPEHCAVQSNSPLNGEAEQQKDVPVETVKISMEKDEKRRKSEGKAGVKENGESGKEDYIHIRAKGGQATNNHSLAERVRREKISERMRLLQDLVPGCNKIAGKALMLDEIINYVQSLQRQAEFLSMKLATVNPEINLDIEQNLQSMRYGSLSAFDYGLEMGTSHPNSRDFLRTANPSINFMGSRVPECFTNGSHP